MARVYNRGVLDSRPWTRPTRARARPSVFVGFAGFVGFVAFAPSFGCAAAVPRGPDLAGVDESRGDAAKILCEAECRRELRCDGEPSEPCLARCAQMPVRTPPIWSARWATEVASCVDSAGCGHDADEVCVLSTHHHSQVGDTCRAEAQKLNDQPRCAVLQGLTPAGEEQMRACLAAGKDVDACTPPYDWK